METITKNRHQTQQERIEIQECLSKGMTFKAIAKLKAPFVCNGCARRSRSQCIYPRQECTDQVPNTAGGGS